MCYNNPTLEVWFLETNSPQCFESCLPWFAAESRARVNKFSCSFADIIYSEWFRVMFGDPWGGFGIRNHFLASSFYFGVFVSGIRVWSCLDPTAWTQQLFPLGRRVLVTKLSTNKSSILFGIIEISNFISHEPINKSPILYSELSKFRILNPADE